MDLKLRASSFTKVSSARFVSPNLPPKMRPRIPARRIIFIRALRPPNTPRLFTQNTLLSRPRPQLPFLSSSHRRPIARFLTTERRAWIKDEVWKAGKYTVVLWTAAGLLFMVAFGVQQEWLERKYPTPEEWSWVTRKDFRSARWGQEQDNDPDRIIDWTRTGFDFARLLKRLEDPNIDGAGIKDAVEGGILVAGIGKTGYDITAKSEPWRRGYYQIMMGAARSAEFLDGWVKDKSQYITFPADQVVGPSNPNPKPVRPGLRAPREEDCEVAFDSPDTYYMRILTTQGFTDKQRMDAALAYAAWLDYKKTPEAAYSMYQWAMDIATSSSPDSGSIVDGSGVLNTNVESPSANVLSVTTALAVHHATNTRLSEALPIFISVLRARRSLPDLPTTMRSTLIPDDEKEGFWKVATAIVRSAIKAPPYPPPPDDGTAPPLRGPKERCQEAGIMTYIGEILYASKQTKTSKEDGLAWTREAVDLAEEELRRRGIDKDARKACKECLKVGLGNWMTMVTKMAKEEKEMKAVGSGGWLGFGADQKDGIGRWDSEEQVIKERLRRSAELLEKPSR